MDMPSRGQNNWNNTLSTSYTSGQDTYHENNGSEPTHPHFEQPEESSHSSYQQEPRNQPSVHNDRPKETDTYKNSTQNYENYQPSQNVPPSKQIEPKKGPQKLYEKPDTIIDRPVHKSSAHEGKNNIKPRTVKSAHRGASDKTKHKNPKIISNSNNAENQKRSSSYKDRKQKSSPIRTTKVAGKSEAGVTHYFSNKNKNSTGSMVSQVKAINPTSLRTAPAQPSTTTYKEPIHQHANLLKAHNLSLNNFKTEIRLPHAQKFMAETQFVKSPFLSKTLKGMMQTKPTSKGISTTTTHASNYGRLGNNFPISAAGRRQRETSGNSNKSKRETSGSHKKTSKAQQKLFATK